jgi:hypothetical protein
MFDNAWFVASRDSSSHHALQEELARALQAHRDASRDLERARAVSPAAVAVALSSLNSTQAALGRAEARAAAATRCTHVVEGHAFQVRDQTGVTGSPEREVRSCTLDRVAVLVPPGEFTPVWTARLTDSARRHLGVTTVNLSPNEVEAFAQVCLWVMTGDLARALRTPTYLR